MSGGGNTISVRADADPADAGAIERSALVVASGGVLVYPTDTIYGLGCDAGNREAVERIYEIKHRPASMPMIVLVGSVEEAAELASEVSPTVAELLTACWPGPLTVLLRANASRYPWLSAGSGKVGVRFPKHPFCTQLMAAAKRPLLSTSANLSGEPYVSDVQALKALFSVRVDLFVDAGTLPPSLPSTIVDGSGDRPVLVREGAMMKGPLERFFA